MPKPTLTPADIPVEQFADMPRSLREQAERIAQSARDRLEKVDTDGAVARYEAALARYQIAAELDGKLQRVVAKIAETHAERTRDEVEHRWPIPHLENFRYLEASPSGVFNEAEQRRAQLYPKWGIEAENGEVLTVMPDARPTGRGDILLTVTQDGRGAGPSQELVTVNIQAHQLDALMALAARIRDGQPIPYDTDGNVRMEVS